MKWRVDLNCKNMEELVDKILKLILKFKLAGEIKDSK